MNFQYLILGLGFVLAGIICSFIYFKLLIKDIKIRKNAVKLEGKIVGIKNNFRFSIIPVFQSDEVKNNLTSLRTVTAIKVKSNKAMELFYNSNYPNQCTHGSMISLLIEFLLAQSLAIYMIVLGVRSIMMFID